MKSYWEFFHWNWEFFQSSTYQKILGKGLIVVKTLLSKDGVVRTVIVALNNRRAKGTQVLAKDEMEVGAQRLCLILPVSEQNTEERARVDQWIDARVCGGQD